MNLKILQETEELSEIWWVYTQPQSQQIFSTKVTFQMAEHLCSW